MIETAPKPKKLLIVDDEADIRELLAEQLSVLKVEIVTADDGQDALVKLKEHQFNVILSDLKMTKMSGMQLLKEVRAAKVNIPFIILTGHGDSATAAEALKLGAYDFLQKPWDEYGLMNVIRRALSQTVA